MTPDGLARIRTAAAEASHGDEPDLAGVNAACVNLVRVGGAGLTLMHDEQIRDVVYVSDRHIEQIEDLQFVLGEGPSIEAHMTGRPVFEPDLDQATRWAEFVRGARDSGVRAVFALPLNIGAARIGSMTLYRTSPGMLSDEQLANAFVLAGIATDIVLDLQAHVPAGYLHEQLADAYPYGPRVHQATGRVAAQLNTTVQEALVRLRSHAFATSRSLSDVTADVVAGRLRFD